MMRLNPDSADALGLAAQFHLELTGNIQRAQELAGRAMRLEESTRRARERKLQHVAFSLICDDISAADESMNAMITISLDRSRLGEIVATNSAAGNLLGASSVLGMNVNVST